MQATLGAASLTPLPCESERSGNVDQVAVEQHSGVTALILWGIVIMEFIRLSVIHFRFFTYLLPHTLSMRMVASFMSNGLNHFT